MNEAWAALSNDAVKDAVHFALQAARLTWMMVAAVDSIACRINVRIVSLVPQLFR